MHANTERDCLTGFDVLGKNEYLQYGYTLWKLIFGAWDTLVQDRPRSLRYARFDYFVLLVFAYYVVCIVYRAAFKCYFSTGTKTLRKKWRVRAGGEPRGSWPKSWKLIYTRIDWYTTNMMIVIVHYLN